MKTARLSTPAFPRMAMVSTRLPIFDVAHILVFFMYQLRFSGTWEE